jgi:hypothetical protein
MTFLKRVITLVFLKREKINPLLLFFETTYSKSPLPGALVTLEKCERALSLGSDPWLLSLGVVSGQWYPSFRQLRRIGVNGGEMGNQITGPGILVYLKRKTCIRKAGTEEKNYFLFREISRRIKVDPFLRRQDVRNHELLEKRALAKLILIRIFQRIFLSTCFCAVWVRFSLIREGREHSILPNRGVKGSESLRRKMVIAGFLQCFYLVGQELYPFHRKNPVFEWLLVMAGGTHVFQNNGKTLKTVRFRNQSRFEIRQFRTCAE